MKIQTEKVSVYWTKVKSARMLQCVLNLIKEDTKMKNTIFMIVSSLLLLSCKSTLDDAYFSLWDKVGVEKREILVDRVEDAQNTQKDAQAQFASALDEFSTLINFDGGKLELIYRKLNDQYETSLDSSQEVSNRIKKVESVAESLFREWESEIELISNQNFKRDSRNKLSETKRNYADLLNSMKKVEASMSPVLIAFRDNVLYLKHNLNANAIGGLKGEFADIKREVNTLIEEMNVAISQSDKFIKTLQQ